MSALNPVSFLTLFQMVLEKDSSVLGYPGEISKPLDADHHGVCKYSSPSDPRYVAVRNVLRTLVENVKSSGEFPLLCLFLSRRQNLDSSDHRF
jgi:hypothetical protein